MDRRTFLKLTAAMTLTSRFASAQSTPKLPKGERFVHINFSNGGMGWLFTALCPPSFLNTADRSMLCTWATSTPLDDVITPRGAHFVIPRPLLASFDAAGDRAAFERVLDGCAVFLGCGTGSPLHQTYAPSFQLNIGSRTTDIASEVARYQDFNTAFPMVNLAGSPLYGSFLKASNNDLSQMFENLVSPAEVDVAKLASLFERLNRIPSTYARTLGTQVRAALDAVPLLQPPAGVIDQLTVTGSPIALRMARKDLVDSYTGGGVNTKIVGPYEMNKLGDQATQFARGAAGILSAMKNGVGCENVQLDGIQDDPHNYILTLRDVTDIPLLHDAMLVKLQWMFQFLVELEKAGLFASTTVLVDGDFTRTLDAEFNDGGVNGVILFSGAKRLRPGYYGDSGRTNGATWYQQPDLLASLGAPIALQPKLEGSLANDTDVPHKVCLGLVLLSMGLPLADAGNCAGMREDELDLLRAFAA